MDTTEDLSARVLVKHILNEEPPRTPLTRSASASARGSGPRRSSRLNKPDPGSRTPQQMLRRSLKHKIRESISRRTLPNKRRTVSAVLKHTPAPASLLLDDGETPRQILKNIMLTEPVKSPVVNEAVESEQPQPSPDSSSQSRRPSLEVSGLDLPDLTVGNIETTVERLTRKRPHRSLNVTAFEKRLRGADGSNVVEEVEDSLEDHSSLSISSSTSLSLKTPFNDMRTERKALKRKTFSRRTVSADIFGAAVEKRELGNYHGISGLAPGQTLSESTSSEGFTLGLSKLSEPDISTDIVHCDTALYAQPDNAGPTSSFLATQDKPTVMASQIQTDMPERDGNQEAYSFPMEKSTLAEEREGGQSLLKPVEENIAAPSQSEQDKSIANRTFDVIEPTELENMERFRPEEADSQTGDNAGAQIINAEAEKEGAEVELQSHTEEEELEGGEEQVEDDVEEAENEEEIEAGEEVAEEEEQEVEDVGALEGVEEAKEEEELEAEDVEEEQEEECVEEGEEEEEVDEGDVEEAQEEEEGEEDAAKELEGENDEEETEEEEQEEAEDTAEEEEEEQMEPDMEEAAQTEAENEQSEENLGDSEHVALRARSPEVELIVPVRDTEEELPDAEYDDAEVEAPDDADKENVSEENDPPDDVEQMEQSEEEEEEEEEEELPLKTPAFVKGKRNYNLNPQALLFSPKTRQPSAAGPSAAGNKPKPKAQRKPRTQKSDLGLPKSYLMNVFKHFAKTKVSPDVYPVLKDVMDKFFDRLAKDLETYAHHAGRSTIEVADCELLLRRQGHINDRVPVEVLIEKYLRLDQRRLLIPIATSGNVVFPKKRK